MKKLEFHPKLKYVPLMALHERDALATNIEKNGQIFPIIVFEGKILDGRNRYLACIARGIEPKILVIDTSKPKEYIESVNYFRKHWTTAERAHFAALMALESEAGRPAKQEENGSNDPVITQVEAAKRMGVSLKSVRRAKAKIAGKNDNKGVSKQQGVDADVQDVNGNTVPTTARVYWDRKREITETINQIHAIRRKVEAIPKDDPLYANAGLNGVAADLKSAVNRLTGAIPAHVCPYCKGVKEKCKECRSTASCRNTCGKLPCQPR